MVLYYIAYLLVLFGCMLPLLFELRWRRVVIPFIFAAVFLWLVLMAGLRSPFVDRDYPSYLNWFSTIRSGSLSVSDFAKDPAFVAISAFVVFLHGTYAMVATLFAALALFFKWKVGIVANDLRLLPLFLYLEFCRFFLVQDLTTIRAGVAIPLVTLSVLAALRNRRVLSFGLLLAALSFHASAALAIPILCVALFGGIKSRKAFLYLAIGATILFILLKGILANLSDLARLADYLNGNYNVSGISLLSVYFLFRLIMGAIIIIHLWHRISSEDKFIVFSSVVGLALQIILSSNETLALRSSEVFGIFDVLMFLIPLKVIRAETRLMYSCVLVVLGVLFFHSGTKIMGPYRTLLSSSDPCGSASMAAFTGEEGGGRRSVEKSEFGTFLSSSEIPQEQRDSHSWNGSPADPLGGLLWLAGGSPRGLRQSAYFLARLPSKSLGSTRVG